MKLTDNQHRRYLIDNQGRHVAGFVLKQTEETDVELVDKEMEFLKSFARLVERLCKDQYNRESNAARS